MTIREMSEAFEVTPRALRFYESKALLAPYRTGQKRLYTKRDRGRLKLILRGKRFGLSLEEIREILDLYDRGSRNEAQLKRGCEIGRKRLAQLESQRAELDETIAELRVELAWFEDQSARHRPAAK
ncbi:MerR family transcriptional regulator [Solirhodobacter olei]|uniref:MerR family transcriptional regulator n=1 Tax=Solirhodobacter olei TaxID=2493082 RepID=UPI000FDC9A28|nr:MerR family DNA-binding transcriptional regulator [Solirhodobacter olei]